MTATPGTPWNATEIAKYTTTHNLSHSAYDAATIKIPVNIDAIQKLHFIQPHGTTSANIAMQFGRVVMVRVCVCGAHGTRMENKRWQIAINANDLDISAMANLNVMDDST